ncbi:hypothetical protein GNT65_12505 [Shewanella sp. JBTF-M18]|uniref:Tetratricopeptide repeat protein n=1 Tax=Shewanella insulae TaxID=2681496 RepID=A0A6L7HZA8_9GAMM|nr:hypothetical protein [Shewanella insulae]MXR69483.1 hypothetical protein [Shewanella insulae]
MNMIKSFVNTAHLYRLGHEAEASVALRQCIDEMEKNYPEVIKRPTFGQIISPMLQAQERQDWLALADYLEYELPQLF